jgi:hypothetical protein
MEATSSSTLTAGELDSVVLERYGVTPNEIVDKLIEIIKGRNISSQMTADGKFKIESENFPTLNITCTFCAKTAEYARNYFITNLNSQERLRVPDAMLHFIREHSHFGDPGKKNNRITPTQACKVLELGNLDLPEGDPLAEAIKFSTWTKEQYQQKMLDDITILDVGLDVVRLGKELNEQFELGKVLKSHTIGNRKYSFGPVWGHQFCTICEPSVEFSGFHEGTIENTTNDKKICLSDLSIHLIDKHGFFGLEERIDPVTAWDILKS